MDILEDKIPDADEDVKKRITDIKHLLNQIMLEVRRISYNLMPSILEDFGLPPALHHLCEQLSQTEDLKIRFVSTGLDERLKRAVEIGLYRIVQEALNNIIKHSGAREATIQLIKDKRMITLIIEDDGKGFDAAAKRITAKRRGMGLMNMKERAESFHATFSLSSRRGEGTEIVVQLEEKYS